MRSIAPTEESDETKRGLQLDRVVLLGRAFEEYRRYFLPAPDHLVVRVTRDEARIYPTVTFEAQPSEFFQCCDPIRRCSFVFREIKTDFEFLVNSNSFLSVTRA